MQAWFHEVATYLGELLEEGQAFTCRLEAEDSESVRVNAGRIRHAGSIAQRHLRLQLIRDGRQVAGTIGLTGALAQDRFPLRELHGELSARLEAVPVDPHLSVPHTVETSEEREAPRLPAIAEVLPEIVDLAEGIEIVGHYIGGRVAQGFATSFGMRRWYETYTYDLELSLCLPSGRAVKVAMGGTRWDATELRRRLARGALHAVRLAQEPVRLAPGRYRAYISPVGWRNVLRTLGHRGAFSLRALRTGTSPFAALHEGTRLAPQVTLLENQRLGWVPPFGAEGFRRPAQHLLIEQGRARGVLVAPRTAAEFGVPSTGADPAEAPLSLECSAGPIAERDVERAVGDGIWLDYLHYLNLSDRRSASVTGLTRFAAFRVRKGELAEPIETARFDDSVLELLGARLVGLTAERQRVPEGRTYERRALGGALLPGAVVEGLRVVS